MCRASLLGVVLALVVLSTACGHPRERECADAAACARIETPLVTPYSRLVATAAIASPTPEPPTPGPPSATPEATATLMPPDPRSITPRPTSPPLCRSPVPRCQSQTTSNRPGRQVYADVDGCHWSETTHGGDPGQRVSGWFCRRCVCRTRECISTLRLAPWTISPRSSSEVSATRRPNRRIQRH